MRSQRNFYAGANQSPGKDLEGDIKNRKDKDNQIKSL